MSTTDSTPRRRRDVAPREATVGGSADGPSDDRHLLQRRARALGSPKRFAIFEYVAKAGTPVRVAALVDRFGLNHNAVRQHLAKLCEAELLVEEFAVRNGPGRPALQYRLPSEVAGSWGTASPYERLASLLLEMTAEGLSPREIGLRAGRQAMATSTAEGAAPLERLLTELRRQGFSPRSTPTSSGVDVVLDSCPYPSAAATHPEIVCEIHRGLIEGFLEELGANLQVVGLQIGAAGLPVCTLQLRDAATGG